MRPVIPLLAILLLLAPGALGAPFVFSLEGHVTPAGDEEGRIVQVEGGTPRGSATGEEVVLGYATKEGDAFAGSHFAPAGQSLRLAAGTPWRSAGAQANLTAADHNVLAQVGTFHFWQLQYFYVEAWVDGEKRVGFFEAIPLP